MCSFQFSTFSMISRFWLLRMQVFPITPDKSAQVRESRARTQLLSGITPPIEVKRRASPLAGMEPSDAARIPNVKESW